MTSRQISEYPDAGDDFLPLQDGDFIHAHAMYKGELYAGVNRGGMIYRVPSERIFQLAGGQNVDISYSVNCGIDRDAIYEALNFTTVPGGKGIVSRPPAQKEGLQYRPHISQLRDELNEFCRDRDIALMATPEGDGILVCDRDGMDSPLVYGELFDDRRKK